MVTSMTGFGKGSAAIGNGEVSVEIRTVNHRYVEFSIRMPRILGEFEKDIEKTLRKKITRGHVYVTVSFDKEFEIDNFEINTAFLKKTYDRLKEFAADEGIPGQVDINTLLSLPEVFSNKSESIPDAVIKSAVDKALAAAVDRCVAMRSNEGEALKKDIGENLDSIGTLASGIEKRAPAAKKRAISRAKKRLEQIMDGTGIDNDRWAMEAALLADRADFSEELVRMKSHLDQFGKILKKGGEVSKKLTFLLQEIHREATTMGNKATDPAIIRDCLSIKEKGEKIREQIQNLE